MALAQALAAEGCNLILTARDRGQLEKLSTELSQRNGIRVIARPCDVAKRSETEALGAFVRREFKQLDILVNNAGISHPMAAVETLDPEAWDQVVATNLTGMFLITRAALGAMKRGAVIVNNLSVAARGVFAGEAAYVASKYGALGFTNTLREEVREKGIRVLALMPGPTDTAIWNQFWPEAPKAKMMSPATVAAAVVSALVLPSNSSVDELVISPAAGRL
jgi:NAD(P)-dependent dehydrogenase (short-subunit alcohol dehydrogenase family)